MILFSKKGLVLVFLGIGLLLSLLGPSDARKCVCSGTDVCPNEPSEKECLPEVAFCTWKIETDPVTKLVRDCSGDDGGKLKKGCNRLQADQPYLCLCDTELCNEGTLQVVQEMETKEPKYDLYSNGTASLITSGTASVVSVSIAGNPGGFLGAAFVLTKFIFA